MDEGLRKALSGIKEELQGTTKRCQVELAEIREREAEKERKQEEERWKKVVIFLMDECRVLAGQGSDRFIWYKYADVEVPNSNGLILTVKDVKEFANYANIAIIEDSAERIILSWSEAEG